MSNNQSRWTRVQVGTGESENIFWMDGSPEEVFNKIEGRFKTYQDRPTVRADKETARSKSKTETKEAVAAWPDSSLCGGMRCD